MNRYLAAAILPALLLLSCKSATNPDTPAGDPPAIPSLAQLTLTVPDSLPGPIQDFVITANSLASIGYLSYVSPLAASEPALQNGVWTWTHVVQTLTITLQAQELANGSIAWSVVLDGVEPNTQTAFSNWTALTGTTDPATQNGTWTIYDTNSTNVVGQFDWQSTGGDTTTLSLTYAQYAVTGSQDLQGNGAITVNENGKKTYDATWTAAGGSWFAYDPNTQQVTDSGTWTN